MKVRLLSDGGYSVPDAIGHEFELRKTLCGNNGILGGDLKVYDREDSDPFDDSFVYCFDEEEYEMVK